MSALGELNRQVDAVRMLLASLQDEVDGDEELRRDMVEGSTNLIEAAHACVERVAQLNGLRLGIKTALETLKARDARYERQEKCIRDALMTSMDLAGLTKIEAPAGTISRKAVPPSVVIVDESLIPSPFWRQPKPVLNMTLIREVIKKGEAVPGAELNNGGQCVQIRLT